MTQKANAVLSAAHKAEGSVMLEGYRSQDDDVFEFEMENANRFQRFAGVFAKLLSVLCAAAVAYYLVSQYGDEQLTFIHRLLGR